MLTTRYVKRILADHIGKMADSGFASLICEDSRVRSSFAGRHPYAPVPLF
jgi:hypothetical protein